MGEGLTPELCLAAAFAFGAVALLLARPLGPLTAGTLALVKAALPTAYFTLLGRQDWRILDDVTYAEEATDLLAGGTGTAALLFDPTQGAGLMELAGGWHFGYYVWNVLAQEAFGPHYWAPVFPNVVLTAVAALALNRMLRRLDVSEAYRRAALLFFLLHWDVLVWSSLLNLKDTVVLCLAAWLLELLITFVERLRPLPLLLAALLACLLLFFRYYVPVLCVGAVGAWGFLQRGPQARAGFVVLGLVLGAWLLGAGRRFLPEGMLQAGEAAVGALRFVTTPRPWGIEDNYRFLLLPSILHWAFLPVAAYGALDLWRRHPRARAYVLFVLVLVAFYAFVPRLQGPRHRFQATFALALFQFHGVALAVFHVLGRPRGAARPVAAVSTAP